MSFLDDDLGLGAGKALEAVQLMLDVSNDDILDRYKSKKLDPAEVAAAVQLKLKQQPEDNQNTTLMQIGEIMENLGGEAQQDSFVVDVSLADKTQDFLEVVKGDAPEPEFSREEPQLQSEDRNKSTTVDSSQQPNNQSFDFEDMQYRDALGNTVANFVHEQKRGTQQIVIEEVDCVKKNYIYNIAVMSESKDDNLAFIWSLTKVRIGLLTLVYRMLNRAK